MAILKAEKTTKRFGGLLAVDELDLEIRENSIHTASSGLTGLERRPFSTASPASIGLRRERFFLTTTLSSAGCLTRS